MRSLPDLDAFLSTHTLDSLWAEMKSQGISQKAFAEAVGMNPRHLSAVRSSELRNHFYNELGVIKLAVVWVVAHFGNATS